ncbi:hypothetical protein [Streptomyces sp. ISL-99]|uniref:hypothetical protein n=1 Tax=Streptomyces sp. ISL-99 TaxID=2819193 RepID=UPI001BEB420C|nr:hypothetical protein [Streptomyces sp. ISL-99]
MHNLTEQAQQLRALAREFEALHARVRDVSYTPGTDALRQISPLLLKAQDLTATIVVRLGALDGSAYANVAGSRASLECLASVVVASSLAGNDLASALSANPYEGAPFPSYPADDEAVRYRSPRRGHTADDWSPRRCRPPARPERHRVPLRRHRLRP